MHISLDGFRPAENTVSKVRLILNLYKQWCYYHSAIIVSGKIIVIEYRILSYNKACISLLSGQCLHKYELPLPVSLAMARM